MDHLSVTRMMIEILEQLDVARPETGQACEELVTLQRLVRTPSGD